MYCSCIWICYECGYSDHLIIIVIMIIIIATLNFLLINSFDAVDEDAIVPSFFFVCFSFFFFLEYTGIYIFRVGESGDRNT